MKRLLCFILGLCLSLNLIGCAGLPGKPIEEPFTLTFITVGKGDAFLLQTPEGNSYLIDTGKAEDFLQIARAFVVQGAAPLDGIFLTHGHKDHVGSLRQLVHLLAPAKVYVSGLDTVSYHEILPEEICADVPTDLVPLYGGETLDLGGVTAEVWLPDQVDTENENNNSMVLRLTHDDVSFLMMGDAEHEEELQLMKSGFPLKSTVLKLGHHGEDDATSEDFLLAVQPTVGLIAGNAEENPESVNNEVSRRLEAMVPVVRYADCDGLGYVFTSDGESIHESVLQDWNLVSSLKLSLAEVDRAGQRVTIRNDADYAADLTCCIQKTKRGDECYIFPSGTKLAPGETISVACLGHEQPGDLVWQEKDVWKPDRDKAQLYDGTITLLDEQQEGD